MPEAIIKKNGTDYPLQTMPLHYPADRVYLDGDINKTVQDAINKGSVSVTANGTKTYSQMLSELKALIDFSKVSARSYMRIITGSYSECYNVLAFNTVDYAVMCSSTTDSGGIYLRYAKITSTGSYTSYYSGSGNISDMSSNVVNSGNIFRFTY